jgi:hypothetical protein
MKQSKTVISAILVVAVFLTALGLSSCSKKTEEKSGSAESKTGNDPRKTIQDLKPGDANELAKMTNAREEKTALMRRREREKELLRDVSPEERARLKDQRETIQKRWENMSDKEKEEFQATMRKIRQKGEDMTKEEREKYMAELREKLNGGR